MAELNQVLLYLAAIKLSSPNDVNFFLQAVCPAPTTNREDIELWEGSRGTAWFKADDIVYYRCSEFYIPAGGSGIGISTCNSDGSWTSFSLRCRGWS